MTTPRTHRLAAAAAVTALGLSMIGASTPAGAAGDKGLFGTQDPTFDGVYRQGLAIAGLSAVGSPVPRPAVKWLLRQQCGNGAFQAYRSDASAPCDRPDPVNYSGRDTNSTAMAAMALVSVGRTTQARAALRYARNQQNADGGFPWFAGGDSDTNSTGLVLAALKSVPANDRTRTQTKAARKYLARTQLSCTAPKSQRGLMPFQGGLGTPDSLGSGQSALGLLTTLPAAESPKRGVAITCDGADKVGSAPVTEALVHALARTLKANGGLMPNSYGDGADVSASAAAVVALRSAGWKPAVTRTSLKKLKRQAATYTVTDDQTNAGATGTLLLAAGATGSNPRSFGGLDLITQLKDSIR